jgi:hypothetical protein
MFDRHQEIPVIVQTMYKLLGTSPTGSFTIEPARGETYNTGEPTLYFHDVWPTGSVLVGHPRRTYINEVPPSFHDDLPQDLKDKTTPIEGTSHIPMDERVAHLPDDDD